MTRAYARPAGSAGSAAPSTPAEPARPPAEIAGDASGGLTHPGGRVPVPYRITLALGDRYGPQVDRALGGREPMVDRWEDGTLIPTPWQVRLLAGYTGYPLDWFYLPEPAPLGQGWICYRRRVDGRRCHPLHDDRPGPPPPATTQGVLF